VPEPAQAAQRVKTEMERWFWSGWLGCARVSRTVILLKAGGLDPAGKIGRSNPFVGLCFPCRRATWQARVGCTLLSCKTPPPLGHPWQLRHGTGALPPLNIEDDSEVEPLPFTVQFMVMDSILAQKRK
jgi:hypothetical protein